MLPELWRENLNIYDSTDDVETILDWNCIFTYFVTILPTKNYKLFFINLFARIQHCLIYGRSIEDIIDEVENDNKYFPTATKLFELLKTWRETAGMEANVSHIENTLRVMGHALCLEKFMAFMKNPPKVRAPFYSNPFGYPQQLPTQNARASLCISPMVFAPNVGLPRLHYPEMIEYHDRRIQSRDHSFRFQSHQSIIGFPHHNPEVLANMSTSATPIEATSTPGPSFTSQSTGLSMKRSYECDKDRPSSDESRELLELPRRQSKKREKHTQIVPDHCKKLVPWNKINTDSLIDLLKTCFPLKWFAPSLEHFYLFLYHTVSCIMNATNKTEMHVLSLEYDDYKGAYIHKTKRGNLTHIVDTKYGCMALEQKEWECLKLYVDHAREKIYKNKTIEESKYVFVKLDGQPILQQMEGEKSDLQSETSESKEVFQEHVAKYKHTDTGMTVLLSSHTRTQPDSMTNVDENDAMTI